MKYVNQNVRRQDRILPIEEADLLLDTAEYGFLSTVGKDGAPYGIPINFVRDGETIVLHCAPEGRKIDNIRHEKRVSFCVVGKTEVVPSQFSTRYESVVVSGEAKWIEEGDRKTELLMKLAEKYAPDLMDAAGKAIAGSLHRTAVVVIKMETVTGKAKR